MGHEDRDRHVFEDVPRGATKKKLSPRRMTIRSHHDQVGIRLVCDIQYLAPASQSWASKAQVDTSAACRPRYPTISIFRIARDAAKAFLASADQNRHMFCTADERHGSVNRSSRLLASIPCDKHSLADRRK